MEGQIAGAALGAVFQEALRGIFKIINMGRKYPSTLETNISTLENMRPLVHDIVRYNQELDRPRAEVETLAREMQAGEELVRRYSDKSLWKFLCFPYYQKKLQAGDESLRRTLSVDVQAQMARDLKETLKKITDVLLILSEQFGPKNYCLGTALYGIPENPDFTVGLDKLLNQLKFDLLKGSEPFLNLTGFGGSGKTTLAKKLCWDPEVLGKFEKNIFFATFSKTPNLKIIVEKLFEHFGQPKPEFQSNEDPGYKLRNLLQQVGGIPIILVLDDVWPGSECLVEKFKVSISDLKILVTSRVRLDLESCISHRLEELSHEDSMKLFRHYAQLKDTCPQNAYADQAVRCCGGLPLSLQIIGSKLRGKPIEFWQIMVQELSRGGSLLDSDDEVLAFLQKGLDVLEDKSIVKECFMDLGLFPEDQMIPVSALFDIWTELHNLPEEFCAMPYVYDLTSRNLSTVVVTRKVSSEADNYYHNHFLMQHDLLRDLAIHLCNEKPLEQRENLIIDINKNNHPELWSEPKKQGIISRICHQLSIIQKQKQVTARSVSISSGLISLSIHYKQSHSLFMGQGQRFFQQYLRFFFLKKHNKNASDEKSFSFMALMSCAGEAFTSKWWIMKPCRAEILVLNIGGNDYALPGFIKYMRKLKVLILINYSFHRSQIRSFELLGSLSNLKRIRLQRVSVPSLCKLKNLRKLSLYMCDTSQAFTSDTSIKDAVPNLVDMSIDYCKDLKALPVGFCDITSLEKLSITNCHSFSELPHDLGNLENLQVLRLNNCTDLVDIPDSVKMLQKLSLLDMSYCINLRRLPEDVGELSNLSKLYLAGCSRLSELPTSVIKLEKLRKVICDEEIAILLREYFDHTALKPSIEMTKDDNNFNLNWLFGQ